MRPSAHSKVETLMMKTITNYDEYTQCLNEDAYSVFMYTTDTCVDCAYAERFMPALEALYPTVHFYRVKRGDLLVAFKEEPIDGVPSFAIYKNGKRYGLYTNRYRKNVLEVKAFFDKTLNKNN